MAQPYYEHHKEHTPPPDEDRVRCNVCGFRGIDAERTGRPETTPTVYTVTGTVYDAHDIADIDLVVTATVPAYAACPFCGSGNWESGNRGDL